MLRIEVWVPSHLGGGAALQTTLEMISVPDTGRLSMHRMRSQTRWSVIGLCVWLHMPCVWPQICLHPFAHAALVRVCSRLCKCYREEDWLWCCSGRAYGGLAVIHGCGWMAEGSLFQLLITKLYPATTFSLFLPLALFISFTCRIVSSLASSVHFLRLPAV